MRTTLDIDDRAMAAARAKAAAEGVSIGRALSDLVLDAMARHETVKGFPIFAAPEGHVITNELIDAHRDDD